MSTRELDLLVIVAIWVLGFVAARLVVRLGRKISPKHTTMEDMIAEGLMQESRTDSEVRRWLHRHKLEREKREERKRRRRHWGRRH